MVTELSPGTPSYRGAHGQLICLALAAEGSNYAIDDVSTHEGHSRDKRGELGDLELESLTPGSIYGWFKCHYYQKGT